MAAASSAPPTAPPGQGSSAPGSRAPARATAAIHPAGTPAHQASSFAAGIHSGAAASEAKPSTVAGAAASSASRLQGTATRLIRDESAATTGAHTAWAAAAAPSASANRGRIPRRRRAPLHRGARVSRAPVARTESRKPGLRASHGSWSTSSRTAAASAGTRDLRRPVARASRVTAPQAAARRTLGSGRHTTTNASVSAAPHRAVDRRERPRRGASPPRSACWARAGAPMSRKSTTVRLDPDTASRWSRSVARKASCRSGGTLEVSPTTSPGNRAPASGARPAVASRSPARSRPARRCSRPGPPVTLGGVSAAGRSSATARSPARPGLSRATADTRVEGSSRAQSCCPASTRTGVATRVRVPSGPVTPVTRASSATTGGPAPFAVTRGSEATVNSASTRACSAASPTTGPARASARWSPATPAPAAAHSRAAAAAAPIRRCRPGHRHPARSSSPAPAAPRAAPAALQRAGASRARAAAAQAAAAGTASRRSTGPGRSGPVTAAPGCAGRRSAVRRCRRPGGAPPRNGNHRGRCGSPRCAAPGPAPPPAARPVARPWPSPD